ncbi:uncharacterized protein LOC143890544 [Tasmannia lanceolata]|uniref:uncharacterized protein LOC143890544 n=1 Tax=Tasmannia lanceolata TaxID=3420 RepID=UPI004063C93D
MANDPVDPMITIQEMLRNMCRDIAGLKDEVTHLKDQSTQKVSTSKDPAIQPPPATSPNLTRPVISPVEIDLKDEQYAGEYFVPPVNKENELFDKYEKMARDIESMKVQASKGFDISEFLMSPNAIFPPKFKAPDYDKYDGTGCPRNHVRWFITLSQQHGLSREQMAHLFPMSLIGVAKRWFLRLKPEEIRTLEEISNRFVEQFSMEEGIEVTKRDLKLLKQNPQETFTSFIRRWRRKSAQLSHRMSEEDQIKLVLKSLSPQYFHFMAPQHYQNFDHLIKTGTQIEDAIAKGLRAKTLSDVREGKRPMIQPKEVQAVSYTRPVAKPVDEVVRPMVTKQFRQFDPLPFPLPMILKKLIRDKKIRLPDVKPVPNPLPGNWRRDQYCEYHRGPGHMTENCLALKHAIQNMIDKDELAVERPNITQNPLPNHRAVAPPTTNAIFVDEPILDPSALICAITSDKTYVLNFDDEELREFREKEPYVLSFDDAELAESSSAHSYVLQNVGLEEAKEATYVLRMEDFEEDVSNAPYVFRTDEDELLLLDDQCNEMRHMTRGGRVFKPPELSVENPAGVARNSENQRQNKVSADEEDESLNRVITVKGDPDLEIGQITPDITGERSKDVNLTGFSLEVTTITFKEALNEEICFLTSTNSNVIRMIRRQGYMPGAGLGKYHQEFWLDESTGQMLPGFEIFFDLELEDEPVGMQIVETESEADWTEHIEPSLLNSLFQEGSQTVAVIFQYKRIPSEESVVHKYVSVSGFDSESISSNESFDAGTIEDHSPEIGDVSSFSSEIELESVHNKASVAVSFYSSESVDAGVNISIESVKMSPKFIVPPDEGNSSVDVYDSNSNEMKDSSFEYIPVKKMRG